MCSGQPGHHSETLSKKITILAGCQWLMPIILATQEAEIRRIKVQSQPGQTVCETLSLETLHKIRAGGVAQDVCPTFKPQYHKKKIFFNFKKMYVR
jgi:hypothetical protein